MYARLLLSAFLPVALSISLNAQSNESTIDTAAGSKTLKEVYIKGKKLIEMERVGEYNQPVWSTFRKFPTTRIYVQVPKGVAMYEKWMEIRESKNESKPTEIRMRDELALGLGHRLELDLYLHTVHTQMGANSTLDFRAFSWEIRYALADWGKVFGNPTLYFEYMYFNNDYDKIEPKLLLGGNLTDLSIWGVNLVYERQLAGIENRDEEFAATSSYSRILSNWFSAGASYRFGYEIEREEGQSDSYQTHLIGPSFQLKFHSRAFIDVEPLFSLTKESLKTRAFIIFGWRF
jgi:hypothetical protein